MLKWSIFSSNSFVALNVNLSNLISTAIKNHFTESKSNKKAYKILRLLVVREKVKLFQNIKNAFDHKWDQLDQ